VAKYIENNKQILDKIHSFHQSKIYKMYEGTVVRMFFWKHKWFLSTHKKKDDLCDCYLQAYHYLTKVKKIVIV
jgi:hypothetical protein